MVDGDEGAREGDQVMVNEGRDMGVYGGIYIYIYFICYVVYVSVTCLWGHGTCNSLG